MTTRLVLATRNAHKVVEFRRILALSGLDVELVDTDAFPDLAEVVESEDSFAGNSLLKARAVSRHAGLPAVADDSGLCVDALNGMPGILSARWSGASGDDAANVRLLLGQLADVPEQRLTARFRCAAALVLPDGTEDVVEGVLEGSVVREPRGDNGFGYDPVFVPAGRTERLAELTDAEKDAISHRGQALRALVPVLRERLS